MAPDHTITTPVKPSAITEVKADGTVDDPLFTGTLADKPVTPIIINQNLLDILITPGAEGKPATAALTPAVSPWKLVSEVQTVGAGKETEIEDPKVAPDDANTILISGTIAAGSAPALKVYELEDPATFARMALIEALQRVGVTVSANPTEANPEQSLPDQATVAALRSAARLVSLPLGEEVKYVMKISYNRGAQTLVCRLAVDAGKTACNAGMPVMQSIWAAAKLDTLGASLVDGSGLDGNLITAQNAVDIQAIMAKRPDAKRWQGTMPILGVDGSLADVQADSKAAGKVFAKTGPLLAGDAFNNRYRLVTKTLGGVMDNKKGGHLAFTIMVNQGFYTELAVVFEANDDVGKVAALIQQAY
ncbi:D-alanyl-D-alanine carboxypeptidase [Arthrobacter sp. E3]|uniref:D-alanyl-D-alanine carboxypeptidase n=1 Tax=Arthrobacter sp. E3 TaxID=517402 RepID=UPI001A940480|nr:D-alanyl-D-alanine carboxypeptidase [Arthrobacter sp. E3]